MHNPSPQSTGTFRLLLRLAAVREMPVPETTTSHGLIRCASFWTFGLKPGGEWIRPMQDRKRRPMIIGHIGRGERLTPKVVLRYALIQLPGTVLLVLVILLINRWWVTVPLWLGLGIVGLAIVKDLVLFPLVWRSYAGGNPDDPSSMIGRRGIVIGRLDPEGYVRVRGELWRAETVGNDRPVEEGRSVAVVAVSGLKLYVRTDLQGNGPPG